MRYPYVLVFLLILTSGVAPAQKPGLLPRGPAAPTGAKPAPPRPDPTLSPLVWRVRDRVLQAGSTESIDFVALNFNGIAAYQFALRFDTAYLHFEQIEVLTTGIPLDPDGNFGLYTVQAGEIRTLWSAPYGLSLPLATKVFRIVFTVRAGGKKLGEALAIDPALMAPVAYNSVLADKPIHLFFADYVSVDPREATDNPAGSRSLLTNFPNPFTDRTRIRFFVPEAGPVHLTVTDASGRTVAAFDRFYPAGEQEEMLEFDAASARGLLYCTVQMPGAVLTRILLRL